MAPILSSSKALSRLLSSRSLALDSRNGLGLLQRSSRSLGKSERLSQAGSSSGSSHWKSQSRWFLGVGDGEEGGNVLAKTHEERRVMGYSPDQLFAVVAAVDLYEDFVPWCQRSKILRRNDDGSFDAELEIGFKFLVESYVSHVVMKKPNFIKTTASESNLFDYLINIWQFKPGPVPGSCELYFMVDFKFQSPLYRQVASMFFKEVVSRLVGSFSDRCRRIYGPGVQVFENAYGQGRDK
ncbi:coenzyme Q-binding protein COQ10 homolog, mitochondrial-like isoform X2 [Asparagus officinalis]|uniref:coenzyme Q-binding protein COQ10 homolog, mitochondrial-like isoform X2 n=1 Tax=Asparagus officinalis TaxID=4686 RepID=UPI00098E1184|nr:coenzyme Q-binding protein COQ10 homolog, mitochondrial-like isoform X2 [Asparagus officinalis]